MNLSFKVTLDGLLRALRWQVHDLAEGVERQYGDDAGSGRAVRPARRDKAWKHAWEADDDRSRR